MALHQHDELVHHLSTVEAVTRLHQQMGCKLECEAAQSLGPQKACAGPG